MFVRRKKVRRHEYYQLVENYREPGRATPRQRVVLHLGHHATLEEALQLWPREIKRLKREAKRLRPAPSWDSGFEDEPFYRRYYEQAEALEAEARVLDAKLQKLRAVQAAAS